jgi:carbon monoxide dehydrogenase subunit G
MKFIGQRSLLLEPAEVWAALMRPEVLRACVPGCQTLEQVDDNNFTASVRLAVGPIKASFKGTVKLEELNEPRFCALNGEGNGGIAGFAKGGARITLSPADSGTRLDYDAEVQIGGKLAAVGSRLFESVTRKNIDIFFDAFEKQCQPGTLVAE